MKQRLYRALGVALIGTVGVANAQRKIVYETATPYHHIQVIDRDAMRTIHFDSSSQSRVSLKDPLQGHFEYTEYFHMPWLWTPEIKSVLFLGLGGSSIQRAYQAYHPEVETLTIELDPKVVEIAKTYFGFEETERTRVITGDGRLYLRRTQKTFDLIVLDAYTANRYGSYIPYSLTTQECFALAKAHLSPNGVLAYNVIGNLQGRQKNIVGAIYKTLKTSFPEVYMFPAISSYNVVLIATVSNEKITQSQLLAKAEALASASEKGFPNYKERLKRFRSRAPASADASDILTDDFAPVDGLLQVE